MPGFIKADAEVKTGLIDGLAEGHAVASPAAFVGAVDGADENTRCCVPNGIGTPMEWVIRREVNLAA
jgi:hypothetical protein